MGMAENWLREYGFNAVQLPRRDLSPADVMYRSNGSFDQKVGNLSMLFSSNQGLPTMTPSEPTGAISRSLEKKVEASLGVKILGALFGGGSSSKLGADLEAKRARKLTVTYEEVTQDSLAVLALQSWLQQAKIQTARQAMGWLNDEKLAAVTAVLRTANLSIVAERESGGSIDLSVPEIQGLVGADVKVSASSTTSSKITFTGKAPVAFGFQAFKMVFEGNVWFGLEETRGVGADAVGASAWTNDIAIDAIGDKPLPPD
jgi:hypothetical protein